MKHLLTLSVAVALSLTLPSSHAQSMKGMDMKDMDGMKADNAQAQVHKAAGTVSRIDREQGKVTIKHGPIGTLNWPAMSMTFRVNDKALLGSVKEGQKVDFSFIQSGKDYVITSLK